MTPFDEVHTNEAPVGATIDSVDRRTGPAQVPADRYISSSWAEAEAERLWPKVWQVACSVSHVSDPGDWFEYTVGAVSVLIVRGDDGALRAFQNVCLHRGNELCSGAGAGMDEIRCRYHRWSWDLQGRLREVPSRKGFGVLRNDDYPLIPVEVDTWGELVFVNLDTEAEPLDEFLAEVPGDIAWIGVDQYRCRYAISTPLPCNWKVLIEAFSETYHVQGIHREMLAGTDDVNSPQHVWDRHGKLEQPYGIPSPRLRNGATDHEVWRSLIETQGGRVGIEDPALPMPDRNPGESVRDLYERLLRVRADEQGFDWTGFGQREVVDLFQYNLFPNVTAIFLSDGLSVLTARPGLTPDQSIMTNLSFERVGSADTPRAKPLDVEVAAEDASFGLVFDQDVENLRRAQRGLHQPGFTHLTLSGEECRIINLHRNLERQLGIDGE